MSSNELIVTYIGGPTVLLEFGGLRFLTDPTFDPAGGDYTTGPVTLHKNTGPALAPEALGPIDYVLLSHDHHSDNLDHSGRKMLAEARTVFTTVDGASRLGGNSRGLQDWQAIDVPVAGRMLRVVGTPGRHGPEGGDRGPVKGFVLYFQDSSEQVIYVSGDTVWYDGVAEVARRFAVQAVLLHLGAARVSVVGPHPLTMTAQEAIEAAKAFAQAAIIPIHFEDWAHFSEGKKEIDREFANAGLTQRLHWPLRGGKIHIDLNRR